MAATKVKPADERVGGREHLLQMNVDVPVDLVDAVAGYCRGNGVTRKKVVEVSLRRFLAAEVGG